MTKKTSQGRPKINQRLLDAPTGAVLTLAWLKARGISSKLANYYATSGWLHRVGDGAFTLKSGTPDWLGAVFGLQHKPTPLHPGGQTALELVGLAHFLPLGDQAPIYLFDRSGERLPEWFKRLPWAGRVQHVRTFPDHRHRKSGCVCVPRTERTSTGPQVALKALKVIQETAGADNVR